MFRKAVDIVLLPDEKITVEVIKANEKLVEKFGKGIVLNAADCLPHISLAMGCIDESDIPDIEMILRPIAKRHPLDELELVGIVVGTNAVGEKVSSFKLKKTDELQSLHEEIMQALEPFFKYKVTEDMIYGSEIEPSTLFWIRDYRDKSSFSQFSPHITIGYGQTEAPLPFEKFTVSSLALSHLGNHCTCRDVLVSVPF